MAAARAEPEGVASFPARRSAAGELAPGWEPRDDVLDAPAPEALFEVDEDAAAMLVYTGCRLASPREFVQAYKVGQEQLLIFVVTLVTSLATDLLIGVFTGVAVKFLIHLCNGAPLSTMFRQPVSVETLAMAIALERAREKGVDLKVTSFSKEELAIHWVRQD